MALNLKDIIKFHLLGLQSLDEKSQKDLLPYLISAEYQLRSELDRFGEHQFSYAQRIQTINLINNSIKQIESLITTEAVKESQLYFDFGVERANKEVNELNSQILVAPTVPEQKISLDQNNFLINTFDESIKLWSAETRSQVSQAITQATVARKTGYEVVNNLSTFIKAKRWKLQRIFRTENHRIYNAAKLLTYRQFQKKDFPDMMKRLFHPMDHRTADDSKQLKQLNPVVPLGKPFVFTYRRVLKNGEIKEDKRVFMFPPDRPNDRATIIPWRKSWKIDARS